QESRTTIAGGKRVAVLDPLDRHEVGHAVMAQWQAPAVDPPTVLSEGWAEWLGSGFDGSSSAYQLQDMCAGGMLPPQGQVLPTLSGPEWYHQDSGPVYPVGHHLVHLLIDNHGFAKFHELYATVTPDAVEATFARVYGVGLAALERELWEDVRQVASQ